MFFHPTHTRSLNRLYAEVLEGRPPSDYAGMSLIEIAEANGRSAAWLRVRALETVRRSARHGVRVRAMPRSEARRWLAYQEPAVLAWLKWRPGHSKHASQR
jgi:hypothetical protein